MQVFLNLIRHALFIVSMTAFVGCKVMQVFSADTSVEAIRASAVFSGLVILGTTARESSSKVRSGSLPLKQTSAVATIVAVMAGRVSRSRLADALRWPLAGLDRALAALGHRLRRCSARGRC